MNVYTTHDEGTVDGPRLPRSIPRAITRRIGDVPKPAHCGHPEHSPPAHTAWPSGVWEHECPGCGHITRFTVAHSHMG